MRVCFRVILAMSLFSLFALSAQNATADPTLGIPIPINTPSGSPFEVDECKVLYSGGWLLGHVSGLRVKFTNNGRVTADLVEIRVAFEGGQGGILRDVGTFTPGIEVTHNYREGEGDFSFSPLFSHPHFTCTVAAAHFKDGTSWAAPMQQPLVQASPGPTMTGTAGSAATQEVACDPGKAAHLASIAKNSDDVQDYAAALSNSRMAAEILGACSESSKGSDRDLYLADKAEMLAIAGLSSLKLNQHSAAAAYLASAQRAANLVTAPASGDVAKELLAANQLITTLATQLKHTTN